MKSNRTAYRRRHSPWPRSGSFRHLQLDHLRDFGDERVLLRDAGLELLRRTADHELIRRLKAAADVGLVHDGTHVCGDAPAQPVGIRRHPNSPERPSILSSECPASRTVGTSGIALARLEFATARNRALPSCTGECDACSDVNSSWMRPSPRSAYGWAASR